MGIGLPELIVLVVVAVVSVIGFVVLRANASDKR